MTPDKHGYAQCGRCKALRPVRELLVLTTAVRDMAGVRMVLHDGVRVECADVGVCTRLAGVGKGEMPTEATT